MDSKVYSLEDQNRIGEAIAKMLHLRKSREEKGRWVTTWGTKTNVGVFNTIHRLGREIETGEIGNTFKP